METKPHVCPVWVGYLMNSPIRRFRQNPYNMLEAYIRPGMKILEVGPALGFFTIPMAYMTGTEGKIYAVDIQEGMLKRLRLRAVKKKVGTRLDTILSNSGTLNIDHLKEAIDFCLLAYVVHEIPDKQKMFLEIAHSLKPGSRVLFIEPRGHVKEKEWNASVAQALKCGLIIGRPVRVRSSRACELLKPFRSE